MSTFFRVVVPMTRTGFLTASVMAFAHTVGEFGVVLMIGGNIPDETRVASVQIYDYVEALQYDQAHVLAAVLLAFSFTVLFGLSLLRRDTRHAR
jgi:molybdate transport system permease protein